MQLSYYDMYVCNLARDSSDPITGIISNYIKIAVFLLKQGDTERFRACFQYLRQTYAKQNSDLFIFSHVQ